MSAQTSIGGFAELEVNHVLNAACRRVGLDSAGAEILRGHTNAVFRLVSPVVVKIARRGTPLSNVQRTVRLVEWLTSLEFPTVQLLPIEQPITVEGHAVTFWRHLPQPDHSVTAEQLGGPLRALHQLPLPPFDLRTIDTAGAIRRSLEAITALSAQDVEYLSDRLSALESDLADVRFTLPTAVVQGDPQHRNALHDGTSAILCDWDTAGIGDPETDLVTIEIHCRRFGYGAAHYEAFAKEYGFDVTTWDGYSVLRDLRELRMITTNARRATAGSPTLTEVTRRIEGLRRDDHDLQWHIL